MAGDVNNTNDVPDPESEPPSDPVVDMDAWDLSAVPAPAGRLRLWSGVVLAGCVGVLGAAALIEPSPAGVGEMSQLGLGTCGMLKVTGLPCPTCGMTTAFANTVRGRLIAAFWAQPTGLILALATFVVALGAGWSLIVGRLPPVRVPIVTPYRLLFTLLVLLLGGWGFKMATMLATHPGSP